MIYRITKSIRNIPILELNNYCFLNDLEIDVEKEEIVICEVYYGNKYRDK